MADSCGSSGVFARIAYSSKGGPTAADPLAAHATFADLTAASLAFPLADGGTSLNKNTVHTNAEGMSGRTAQSSELTRTGLIIVDGDINLIATPVALDTFLPHVTGKAFVAQETWPATEAPNPFALFIHKDAVISAYLGLRVNTFSLSGSPGEPIKMTMGILGTDRIASQPLGSTWPAALLTSSSVPYSLCDAVFTVNGVTYPLRSFNLTVNNSLAPVYFAGSCSPCGIKRNAMTNTTLQIVVPHTVSTISGILEGAVPPNSLDVKITLQHPTSGMSFSIRCPGLQIPPKDAAANSGEILLDLTGVARLKTGGHSSGTELVFFNDSTP